MTRLELSAWPLAGGSACVFALAVALNRLPWQATLVVITVVVTAWAWQSPPLAAGALGGIAWLCVTGFDVHTHGHITVSGSGDAGRAALLVLCGPAAAWTGRLVEARRAHRRRCAPTEPLPQTVSAPDETG